MQVGDYVRTDKGYISKISAFTEHYTKGKRLGFKEKVIENYLLLDDKQCEIIESIDYSIPPCYPTDEELEKIKKHIVKSSPNIIDLIEVGDYVNGLKVSRVGGTYHGRKDKAIYCDYCVDKEAGKWIMIYDDEIKSIVTKEQFESVEYKLC